MAAFSTAAPELVVPLPELDEDPELVTGMRGALPPPELTGMLREGALPPDEGFDELEDESSELFTAATATITPITARLPIAFHAPDPDFLGRG